MATFATLEVAAGVNSTPWWVNTTTGWDPPPPSSPPPGLEVSRLGLGLLLALFTLVTVGGNLLVMTAVARERSLRTVTNYFVVSLATADLVIGAGVMPLSAVVELTTGRRWLLGADSCDLWHSVDVLASTASILNLSVIALDRYWAITDPINYPLRMSTGRCVALIAAVWFCSAAISFPAIVWWRATAVATPADVCAFTDDTAYLLLSSTVSFTAPVTLILFAYFRIYRAATEQTRCLAAGSKVMSRGRRTEGMTLRIHRGGNYRYADCSPRNARPGSDSAASPVSPDLATPSKWAKGFTLSRRLNRLAKEQKAAKTLGIVMGAFLVCWVPFFVTNYLFAVCGVRCVPHAEVVFPVFSWLGYVNSAMNPVIYACSMRDFRRAFYRILCGRCPGVYLTRTRRRRPFEVSRSTSSLATMNYEIASCKVR